jgi:hypothetical protein
MPSSSPSTFRRIAAAPPLPPLAAKYQEKHRRENRIVACLICRSCHERMGPNHFTLKDGGALCSLCGSMNPLGNLRKMSTQEVTTASEIIVCFTRSGKAAYALHVDCQTVLGPWISFQSAETLERALRYLGATDERIEKHSQAMQQTGQGSSHIRLLPNRKNLLRIDFSKL